MTNLYIDDAYNLSVGALLKAGCSDKSARATANALVFAERDGQKGHGLSRIPSYCGQVISGKVNGKAEPELIDISHSAVVIHAHHGFAYPSIDLALEALKTRAKDQAIAIASIANSHHFGQAGAHVERLAESGLIGLAFSNSPKAMAFWGAKEPALGTNPIAFASPLPEGSPLVIDLALSVAARGKIVNAQKSGDTIPEGWALDPNGVPTTDPNAALQGSMTPLGGAKGAALAMMVEILSAALTGSHFGFEASSFFTAEGEPPNIGHTLLAINPHTLSQDQFLSRMSVLLNALDEADGARLPGMSRLIAREESKTNGLNIPENLYTEIVGLSS